jgi:hypothetical protein
MSDQPEAAPDPIEEFMAVADAREQARTAPAPSKKTDTPAATATKDTPASVEDTPAPETTPPSTDTAPAPVAEEPSDLDEIPEDIRARLPKLGKEVTDWLRKQATAEKRYKELQSKFTPLTQVRADVEKKASLWDAVASDPDAARAASDVLDRKKKGDAAPAPDAGWDFTEHTSEENLAFLDRRMEAKVAAADRGRAERDMAEVERKNALGTAVSTYAAEKGLTPEQTLEALTVGRAFFDQAEIKVVWQPNNVSRLVDMGLLMLPAKPTKTPETKREAPGLAKVASPQSRGVGTPAPSIPKWKRDGKKWPVTAEEKSDFFNSIDVGNVTPES